MSTAHPLRILVIDDDAVMTELLSAILGTRGHEVVTADSGEAALALLPGQAFDVVLTDLQLPGLRGLDLAKALRSALGSSRTRLLGMSGSPPSDRERSAFDAFLLKPFNAEQFTEAAAGSASTLPSQPLPVAPETPILDEAIFTRLSAMLPPDKLQEIYQLTLSDARMRLKLIEQALADNDLDTVRREAHAVKGGAGMVGASELHRLAAKAEKDASTGSTRDTPTLEDFYTACNLLESMLKTRFSR